MAIWPLQSKLTLLAYSQLTDPDEFLFWHYLSLSDQYDLVCHRQWLGSFLHSFYFLGWLVGGFFWGPFSDKVGRWRSHAVSHVMCLLFGAACLLSPNIYWMLFCRFAVAFCTTGYNALNTLRKCLLPKPACESL